MNAQVNGELVPIGGGDPMPLIREVLVVGRRDNCDIKMEFPNISGRHCELLFRQGFWYIRDLNSTNGIKVNGARVQEKLLHSCDEVTIGKRNFQIFYNEPNGHYMREEEEEEDIMSKSLLEKAGLLKPGRQGSGSRRRGQSFDPADFLLDE